MDVGVVGDVRAMAGCGDGVEVWGGLLRGGPISEVEPEDFLIGDFLPSFS